MKTPTYRNKLERSVGEMLGPDFVYEAKRLPYKQVLNRHYLPDFYFEDSKHIVETKGRYTREERNKMLAVKASYPDHEITMIFDKPDAPIDKGSKTTNRAWAEKHGFKVQAKP